jgi:hypothetical protein
MRQILAWAAVLTTVSACRPPVIAGMSSDSVQVQVNPGDKDDAVLAEAQRGCGIYGKSPLPISERCLDGYCMTKLRLFACSGPNTVKPVGEPSSADAKLMTCYLPNVTSIQTDAEGCLKVGGGISPPASPSPLSGGGAISPDPRPLASPAAPPERTTPPASNDAGLDEFTVTLTPAAPSPAPSPTAPLAGGDPCVPYAGSPVDRLRCRWVTGPERDRYVLEIGRSASLRTQMACIPDRDDAERYAACIARGS